MARARDANEMSSSKRMVIINPSDRGGAGWLENPNAFKASTARGGDDVIAVRT